MMGKSEGKRKKRRQRIRWLGSITDSRETVEARGAWGAAVHGVAKSRALLRG